MRPLSRRSRSRSELMIASVRLSPVVAANSRANLSASGCLMLSAMSNLYSRIYSTTTGHVASPFHGPAALTGFCQTRTAPLGDAGSVSFRKNLTPVTLHGQEAAHVQDFCHRGYGKCSSVRAGWRRGRAAGRRGELQGPPDVLAHEEFLHRGMQEQLRCGGVLRGRRD